MMKSQIEVIVRIRPILSREKEKNITSDILQYKNEQNTILVKQEEKQRQFKFDQIITPSSLQHDVYEQVQLNQFLNKVVDGFNCTLFAYGQTGSGKTYTMEGDYQNQKDIYDDNKQGLIPRSIKNLFELTQNQGQKGRVYKLYFSYLQIYNEKIYDLLAPQQDNIQSLRIRWSKQQQFTVENLYVIEISEFSEGFELFKRGSANKIVASHKLNMQSSRSHCILTLYLEQYSKADPDNIIHSKIQLVDLAGSERTSLTGVEGKQHKEAIEINKSLFTLRSVIQHISDAQNQNKLQKDKFIPYRDSKLTQLLKSSIGGQSFCKMIACIAPCDNFIEENISTLKYAALTSQISNQPVINEDPKLKQIRQMKLTIKELNTQLQHANDHIVFLSKLTNTSVKQFGTISKHSNELQTIEVVDPLQKQNNFNNKIQNNFDYSSSNSNSSKKNDQQNYQNINQSIVKSKKDSNQNSNLQTIRQNTNSIEPKIKNINTNIEKLNGELLLQDPKQDQNVVKGLIESVNMVRDLLKSNVELRVKTEKVASKNENLENELSLTQIENQELRDKIEILESLMDQNIAQKQKSQADFNVKKALTIIQEIQQLRKERKATHERISQLEEQNALLSQKVNPSNIKYQEPRRIQQKQNFTNSNNTDDSFYQNKQIHFQGSNNHLKRQQQNLRIQKDQIDNQLENIPLYNINSNKNSQNNNQKKQQYYNHRRVQTQNSNSNTESDVSPYGETHQILKNKRKDQKFRTASSYNSQVSNPFSNQAIKNVIENEFQEDQEYQLQQNQTIIQQQEEKLDQIIKLQNQKQLKQNNSNNNNTSLKEMQLHKIIPQRMPISAQKPIIKNNEQIKLKQIIPNSINRRQKHSQSQYEPYVKQEYNSQYTNSNNKQNNSTIKQRNNNNQSLDGI